MESQSNNSTPLRDFRDKMIDLTNQRTRRPQMICKPGCDCADFMRDVIGREGSHRVMVWIKCRLREIEHDRNRKRKIPSTH